MRLIHKPKSIPLIYQIERCWMKVLLVAVWLFYFLVSVFLVAFCVSLFVCLLSNEYWKWEELRLVCKFLVYTHMVLWITPLSLSFTFLYFWHVYFYTKISSKNDFYSFWPIREIFSLFSFLNICFKNLTLIQLLPDKVWFGFFEMKKSPLGVLFY